MKTLTTLLFTAATLLAQPPVIPLQPNQQINQTFQNINKNSYYLDSKSVVCAGVGVNTITCNPNPPVISSSYALTAYSPGMIVALTVASSNTGASTLNVSSIGAVPILSASGAALTSGQLVAGTTYSLDYTGAAFVITGSSAGGSGTPGGSSGQLQFNNSGAFAGFTPNVNGTGITTPSALNFLNSVATNGQTFTFTNPSAGVVQLGITGTLNNTGLTNSATTVNGQACALGSTCTVTGVPSGVAGGALTGTYPNPGITILNQSTTGNAATATALAALPTPCSTGFAPTGILANGNSTGCASIAGGGSIG